MGGSGHDARFGHHCAVQFRIADAIAAKRSSTLGRRDTHGRVAISGTLQGSSLSEIAAERAGTLQQENGTLLNYVDQSDSFADSASTALLAATTFRYSTLTGDTKHDTAAMEALDLVFASIDDDGWLLNTVDPNAWTSRSQPGAHSPEGQSFVLLLAAAWVDF